MRVMVLGVVGMVGCARLGEWQPVEIQGGLLVIEGEIDDGSSLRCLVDTGAAVTLVRSDIALGADPSMLIGDRELPLFPLSDPSIDPLIDGLGASLGGIDCLLGWDSLEGSPFTIDYADDQLRLSPRGHRDRRVEETVGDELTVPLVFTRPIPMIEVEIQGVTALLGVDTGAQVAVLNPELFERLPSPPPTSAAQVVTADGVLPAQFGALDEISIGGVSHQGVDFVSFASIQIEAVIEAGWDMDGLIGASTLVRYLVTFDDQRSELTLQPYDEDTRDAMLDELRSSLVAERASPAVPKLIRVW